MGIWDRLRSRNKKGAVKSKIQPEGKRISDLNLPIEVYLDSSRKFTEEEEGHMVYLLLNWFNDGKKEDLSSVNTRMIFGLNITRPVIVNQLDDRTVQISIAD